MLLHARTQRARNTPPANQHNHTHLSRTTNAPAAAAPICTLQAAVCHSAATQFVTCATATLSLYTSPNKHTTTAHTKKHKSTETPAADDPVSALYSTRYNSPPEFPHYHCSFKSRQGPNIARASGAALPACTPTASCAGGNTSQQHTRQHDFCSTKHAQEAAAAARHTHYNSPTAPVSLTAQSVQGRAPAPPKYLQRWGALRGRTRDTRVPA